MPTISFQGLSVGAKAANIFGPDFTNPALHVFTSGSTVAWGRTLGDKYIAADDTDEYTAVTTADYTDVEVTTWARKAEVFLRLTDDGRALRVTWNEDSKSVSAHPLLNVTDPPGVWQGEGDAEFDDIFALDMEDIAGWVVNSGNEWTFGVEGIEYYVKWGGVEVFRIRQPYHFKAGKVAIKCIDDFSAQLGVYDVIVTALTTIDLYSDRDTDTFDPRDAGFKDANTTGSITSGTPTLTVADASDFEIGDPIIVEIGTESGLGLRGTVGVGGTWPALSYANNAAMDADTSQVNGKWAYAADTGRTRWWDDDDGQWERSNWAPNDYYWQLCLPIALLATITNIVGNVITLDTNASATATNANVYYDCRIALNFFSNFNSGDWNTEGRRLTIPAGNYACSRGLDFAGSPIPNASPWEVYGQGMDETVLFSPKGAYPCGIGITNANGPNDVIFSVHDLSFIGNFGSNYYHLRPFSGVEGSGEDRPGWSYDMGVTFVSTRGECYNVRCVNHPGQEFHAQYTSEMTFTNCEAHHDDFTRIYLSDWAFQVADSDAATEGSIGFFDCTYTAEYLSPAAECFRADGVHFVNLTVTNGKFASNSSGNFLLDNCSFLEEEGIQPPDYVNAYGETCSPSSKSGSDAIININSNIQPPNAAMLLGGIIRNPTIIIEGFSDVANQAGYRGLIIVNGDNPNVTIEAVPPWAERPCDAPLEKGYIANLIPFVDIASNDGALAVNTDGENTVVDGLRVDGDEDPFWGYIRSNYGPTTITNCVFEAGEITGTNYIATNNITVAEWEAICVNNAPIYDATITWPSALPLSFKRSTYIENMISNVISSEFDVGPSGLRRRVTANVFTVQGTMFMTTEQWEALLAFLTEETLERSLCFGFPAQGVTASAEWLVFMDKSPSRSWLAEDFWEVELSLVVLP